MLYHYCVLSKEITLNHYKVPINPDNWSYTVGTLNGNLEYDSLLTRGYHLLRMQHK